jgi:tyrosinase
MATTALTSEPLRWRRDCSKLTARQAELVRAGYAGMMALKETDDRGYARWAGTHGLPLPIDCQHGTPLFLPWHRAFLYHFERALRDREPDATLAWWNWSTPGDQPGAVPSLYGDEDVDGKPNPLASADISSLALREGEEAGRPAPGKKTFRRPGIGGRRLPRSAEVEALVETRDFPTFNQRLEELHGQVHVWTGGHMSAVPWAGFDPIFWAHHAMVDRLWRLWQLRHNAAGPPAPSWGQALPPFGMTVQQTLDVTLLGYDYASSTSSTEVA